MKHRITQYILIILILTAVAGSIFYFRSIGATQVNSSQETKLTDGLVGYWTFDGNHMDWSQLTAEARDQAGTNHGNVNGAITTAGKIGQALDFNGSGNYINAGDIDAMDTSSYLTVSLWVKKPLLGVYDVIISKVNSASNRIAIGIGQTGDSLCGADGVCIWYGNGSAGLASKQSGIFQQDTWTHVVLVFDGTQIGDENRLKFYKDGIVEALTYSVPVPATTPDNSNNLVIGAYGDGHIFESDSVIDEVRVYNRALTQTEITQLYNQGQAKINASQDTKLTDGLVGNWTFDGNHMDWSVVNEVLDQSGQGNDGDAANMNNSNAAIGKIGQALDFNGTNNRVIVSSPSSMSFGTNSMTMTAWVRLNASLASAAGVFRIDGDTNSEHLQLKFTTSGMIYTTTQDSSGNTFNPTFPDATDQRGRWAHIVMILDRDNSQVIVYENNNQLTPAAITFTGSFDGNDFIRIGDSDNNKYLEGLIDEARIYNRALTQTEITQLYNQGQVKINASQDQKLTDGLVGNWTFDGNHVDWSQSTAEARDQSGSNYHGNVINNVDATIGKIGQAMNFEGVTNESIDIINAPNLNLTSTDFTIVAWVYPLTQTDTYPVFYADGAYRMTFGMQRTPGTNKLEVWRNDSNNFVSNGAVNLNQWNHIAMVWNGSTYAFYRDGENDGSSAGSAYTFSDNTKSIGNVSVDYPSIGEFNGKIDELRIYNRALTVSEINQLYNMGK